MKGEWRCAKRSTQAHFVANWRPRTACGREPRGGRLAPMHIRQRGKCKACVQIIRNTKEHYEPTAT